MPTDLASWLFLLICYLLPILVCLYWAIRNRRARHRVIRQWQQQELEYHADVRLWELLREEDPQWLADMGINPPLYTKLGIKPPPT